MHQQELVCIEKQIVEFISQQIQSIPLTNSTSGRKEQAERRRRTEPLVDSQDSELVEFEFRNWWNAPIHSIIFYTIGYTSVDATHGCCGLLHTTSAQRKRPLRAARSSPVRTSGGLSLYVPCVQTPHLEVKKMGTGRGFHGFVANLPGSKIYQDPRCLDDSSTGTSKKAALSRSKASQTKSPCRHGLHYGYLW